jgi:hypothetical protein
MWNQGRPSCGWKPSRQAVHCVAVQVVANTISMTMTICPQRILDADTAASWVVRDPSTKKGALHPAFNILRGRVVFMRVVAWNY